jgi:hypothetical protein
MNKGKKFELLVAEIERALHNIPGITVEHNIRLTDSNGCERQIDVLITDRRARFPTRTVIECKNTKSKVNINTVQAFIGLLKSTNSQHGIIVSASGYQAGARKTAQINNIHLYQLSESAELAKHLQQLKILIYEIKHQSKDIIVGFDQPNEINEYVTTNTPLLSPQFSKKVTISEIAEDFLTCYHQPIADSMLRSVDNPYKSQNIIAKTEISIVFPQAMLFKYKNLQANVSGFKATIETTLTTGVTKLHKVSTYTDIVDPKFYNAVVELDIDNDFIGRIHATLKRRTRLIPALYK